MNIWGGMTVVSTTDYENLLRDLAAARAEIERLRTSAAFTEGEKSQLLRQIDGAESMVTAEAPRRRAAVLGPVALAISTALGPTVAVLVAHNLGDDGKAVPVIEQTINTCEFVSYRYSIVGEAEHESDPRRAGEEFVKDLLADPDRANTKVSSLTWDQTEEGKRVLWNEPATGMTIDLPSIDDADPSTVADADRGSLNERLGLTEEDLRSAERPSEAFKFDEGKFDVDEPAPDPPVDEDIMFEMQRDELKEEQVRRVRQAQSEHAAARANMHIADQDRRGRDG